MKPDRSFTTDTPIGIYWVGHSTGFRVKGGRRSGTVEEIGVRLDGRVESIAVRRKGFVRSRLIIVPIEAVASVDPWDERVVLARGRWNGRAKAPAPRPPVPVPAPVPPARRVIARPPLPADTEQVQAFTRPVEPPVVIPPVAPPGVAAPAANAPKPSDRRTLIPRSRPGRASAPATGAAPDIAAASAAAAAGAFTARAAERHRTHEPAPTAETVAEASAPALEEPAALVGLPAVEDERAAVVEPPLEEPAAEEPKPVTAAHAPTALGDVQSEEPGLARGEEPWEAERSAKPPPELGLVAPGDADEGAAEPEPAAAEPEIAALAAEPEAEEEPAEEAGLAVAAAAAVAVDEHAAHIHPAGRPEAEAAASARAEPPSGEAATRDIALGAAAEGSTLPARAQHAGRELQPVGPAATSLVARGRRGLGVLALLTLELAARATRYGAAALLRLLLACRALALAVAVAAHRSMPAAHRAAASARRAMFGAIALGTRAARRAAALGVAAAHVLLAAVAALLHGGAGVAGKGTSTSAAAPARTDAPEPRSAGTAAVSGGRSPGGPLRPLQEAYGRWRESRRWVEGRPEPVNAQRKPRRTDIALPPVVTVSPPTPTVERQTPVSPAGSRGDESG